MYDCTFHRPCPEHAVSNLFNACLPYGAFVLSRRIPAEWDLSMFERTQLAMDLEARWFANEQVILAQRWFFHDEGGTDAGTIWCSYLPESGLEQALEDMRIARLLLMQEAA